MSYTRDGHRVDVYLDDGALRVRLECPGAPRCTAQQEQQSNPCWLAVWLGEEGVEFFELQERPYVSCELPVEIEWRTEGWDEDHELWWRPVVPELEMQTTEERAG